MDTLITPRKRLAGFSLVELAIVLLISGILMSAGLSLLTVKRSAAQLDTTQKHQDAIKQALINYLGKYRRLPCPGDSTGGEIRSASATLPPCSSYSGIVPYQTLGLDRTAALDGWENFITYVVSQAGNSSLPNATPPYTTAWVKTFSTSDSNIYTTKTTAPYPLPNGCSYPTYCPSNNLAFWPSTSTGGIKVVPTTYQSPPPIADPANASGAAVVLISYGKNGYGAYNIKGVQNSTSGVGADEQQNIYPVSNVVPTTVKRDATDSTTGGGAFDDVVMILSANDLTGPLIANGTLQSSAQTALSQANDIVMGNIVASITSCTSSQCSGYCSNYNNYNNNGNCTAYSGHFFYTLPSNSTINSLLATTTTATTWGVNYSSSGGVINGTSIYSGTAYTLIADDGATKTVSFSELQGILARGF